MIARAEAPARAALLGNPSDGYGGRVIAFALRHPRARAAAGEEVDPAEGIDARVLVEAARTRFARHCAQAGRRLDADVGALGVAVHTTIPRSVGLGGSSAIVIAVLRALAARFGVEIEPATLAQLALAAEVEELGIAAGPQDRLVEAHGGLVDMDFTRGRTERLDPRLLPRCFLAWDAGAALDSGDVHATLRARHARGDPAVGEAMAALAGLAAEGRAALERGDHAAIARLVDRNFDLRAAVMELDPRHTRMVALAREQRASAHFAGSGGAVLGVHRGPAHLERLREAFAAEGCELIEPAVDVAPR
jgi:glucuronokinase